MLSMLMTVLSIVLLFLLIVSLICFTWLLLNEVEKERKNEK